MSEPVNDNRVEFEAGQMLEIRLVVLSTNDPQLWECHAEIKGMGICEDVLGTTDAATLCNPATFQEFINRMTIVLSEWAAGFNGHMVQ